MLYDYQPCTEPLDEAALLALYAEALEDAHVLTPSAGLLCLRHFKGTFAAGDVAALRQ